jgi:tetratricopeptide (TPR) repeat protein
MTIFSKSLGCCALMALLGASPGIFAQADSAAARRGRIVADPDAVALNNLLAAAQAAMEKKDYAAAAENYQAYLAKKPDDASSHFQLAYAYSALQRSADAKTEYEKAISLDPKMSAAYLNLGLTLLETDPQAAISPLKKAVELSPDQAEPRFLLGAAFERSGKATPAIEQYQAAEKLDTKNFDIHFALARTLLAVNRPGNAELEFHAALALRPESGPAHLGLVQSLVGQKKSDAAEAELAAYLETQPNDTQARIELASVLVDLGKPDAALAQLDRVAAAGPENLQALKLRSLIYFQMKRYDDAATSLQKAAVLAPDDPDIRARLGHVYLEKKAYPDAVRELIVALTLNPNANDVLGDLIAAHYLNKNYPAALEGLDLLSSRQDLPLGTLFIRATCYDKLGQPAQALDAYKKFLSLNKDETSDMYFEATARARFLTRELQNKKR